MTDKEKWMEDTLKKIESLYYEASEYKLSSVSSALGMVEDVIMHEQKRLEEEVDIP